MPQDTNKNYQDRFLDDYEFVNGQIHEKEWASVVGNALSVHLKYSRHIEALPNKIAHELENRIVCGTIDLFVQSMTAAVELDKAYPQFGLLHAAPAAIADGIRHATRCGSRMADAVTGVLKFWPDMSDKVRDLIAETPPSIAAELTGRPRKLRNSPVETKNL